MDTQKLRLVQSAFRSPPAHSTLTRVTAARFRLLPSICLPAPIHHSSLPVPPSPTHSCYHSQEPERTWHLKEESKCRRSESLSSVLILKCDLYAQQLMKHFRSQELVLDSEKLLKIRFYVSLQMKSLRSLHALHNLKNLGLGSQVIWPILKILPTTIVHSPKH